MLLSVDLKHANLASSPSRFYGFNVFVGFMGLTFLFYFDFNIFMFYGLYLSPRVRGWGPGVKIFGYPSCSPMQYIIDLGELLLSNHSKEGKKIFMG